MNRPFISPTFKTIKESSEGMLVRIRIAPHEASCKGEHVLAESKYQFASPCKEGLYHRHETEGLLNMEAKDGILQ